MPISIVLSSSNYSNIAFAWPGNLNELEDGKLVTLKFTLHGVAEGSTEQDLTRVVEEKMS